MSQPMLWITDPWITLDYEKDTTLRLMAEALEMGIPTYWSGSDFIFNAPAGRLRAVLVTPDLLHSLQATKSFAYHDSEPSKFYQIHFRVDPPVDQNYISVVEKLLATGVTETQLFNPATIITKTSEKIPPKRLWHLAPRFEVVSLARNIGPAFEKFRHDVQVVSKPLNLAQSIGVKMWPMPKDLPAFELLVKTETRDFSEPILLEEYLPEIQNGEVRVWYCFGKIIASLKKHPKSGDFRVLIDEGSKVEAHTLSSLELTHALQVGAVLKEDQVALAAIDFIGGKICDYNITSPGLLVQLEKVHAQNFARPILEILQSRR